MTMSDARRLNETEAKNTKHKRLLAGVERDMAAQKSLLLDEKW